MNPWPISPLGANDLNFAVVNYDFSSLTADSLSEGPGIENAIDLSLADFSTSIADQTSEIAVMFDGLDDLLNIVGEIDASPLDGVLGELANTASAGDATLGDFQGQLTGNPGGGGGTAPPTTSPCAVQDFGDVQSGSTKSMTINITNNASATITIKGLVVTGNNGPNLFSLSDLMQGKELAPGSAAQLTINASAIAAQPGAYSSTLTVNTDQPDPQPCMMLQVNVTPGTTPPPGGGGGAPGGGFSGCDVGFDPRGRLGCVD